MTEPDTIPQQAPGPAADTQKIPAFSAATVICGFAAFLLGVSGVAGMYLGIAAFQSIVPGYQTMAFSTAVLLILFGAILIACALRPFSQRAGTGIQAVMILVALNGAIELPLNISGRHFFTESLLVGIGNAIAGTPTSPISPATIVLVILTAIGFFLLSARQSMAGDFRNRDIAGLFGLVVALVSFTIILSYLYGVPIMYGSGLIPVAAPTALAFLAIGAGLMTTAGPGAAPLAYFSGDSIRAHLLRTFLPLTIMVILAGAGLEIALRNFGGTFDAVLTAASIVVFSLIVGLVVFRVSDRVGGALEAADRKRRKAEEELRVKNTELEASYEELTETEEVLRQNYDELAKKDAALQKSEAILNLTQRITSVGGWEYDVAAKRPYWTDEVYRIHGVSKDFDPSNLAKDIRFYSPDDQETIATAFRKAVETGEPYDHELRFTSAKGEQLWVRTLGQAEWSGDKIVRVIGNIIDITERKRAETVLKTERQRLYDVLETLPVYVCLLDPDYRMPFANRFFRETFGESHGRRCYEFLFNRTEPCEICETYTVMKTKVPHHWYWTGPNGRDYDIYDYPFTDSDGSFNILEMGIDITERNRAEAALQKAHDELEERVGHRTAELEQRNEELGALNEEITATQDELQRNIAELGKREQELGRALAEKEVLLSEIHHRVKNNLTAFISLLSLEGAIEDTPAGKMLRQDLQNRARSMSLIHETLYRTKLYDEVDMGIYLTTLLDHIGNSFQTARPVKTVVDAEGVMLDIARATPAGLIVNELVTNSFKYAFAEPATGDMQADPPAITIALAKEDGEYRMTVSDNGPGLPPGFDITKTQTLGLKLVNFLARHQMRAKVEVNTEKGTEFVFRFKE